MDKVISLSVGEAFVLYLCLLLCGVLIGSILYKVGFKRQRDCMHLSIYEGRIYIESALEDMGMSKRFWCTQCGAQWRR